MGDHRHEPDVVVGVRHRGRDRPTPSRARGAPRYAARGGREVVHPVREAAFRGERRDPHPEVDRRSERSRSRASSRAAFAQPAALLDTSATLPPMIRSPLIGIAVRQRPIDRRAEVALLAIEPSHRRLDRSRRGSPSPAAVGHPHVLRGERALASLALAARVEALEGVLPDQGVEAEPVSASSSGAPLGAARSGSGSCRRATRDRRRRRVPRSPAGVRDRLGRAPASSRRRTRRAARTGDAPRRDEELVAPGDRGRAASAGARAGPAPAAEVEAVLEPVADLGRRQHPGARRGQLERQGQAAEPLGDRADRGHAPRRRRRGPGGAHAPVEEQRARRPRPRAAARGGRARRRCATARGS